MSIRVTVDSSRLDSFGATLSRYIALTSKAPQEVLDKKGGDLGWRIWRGFFRIRYKRNIVEKDQRARFAAGIGIMIRSKVVLGRWEKKIPLTQKLTAKGRRQGRDPDSTYVTSRHQRLVAQELLRRKAGAGALSAAFLMYRRRSSQIRGTRLVYNNTRQLQGRAVHGRNGILIQGFAPGLRKIDQRYGIVAKAFGESRADMQVYIERKEREARGVLTA